MRESHFLEARTRGPCDLKPSVLKILDELNDLGCVLLGVDLGVFVDNLAPAVQDEGPSGGGLRSHQFDRSIVDCGVEGSALARGHTEQLCDESVYIGDERDYWRMSMFDDSETFETDPKKVAERLKAKKLRALRPRLATVQATMAQVRTQPEAKQK